MKKILFIDRDGTLVVEPPIDYQLDSLEKLEFYPGVFRWLSKIYEELDYELVLVTNQDGLGTDSFPEEEFWPTQNKIISALKNEGIFFSEILIDKSLPEDQSSNRKPGTGMLQAYIHGNYDMANSFVIGDRVSDMQLAQNLGSGSIFIGATCTEAVKLSTNSWREIYQYLKSIPRTSSIQRTTKETDITVKLNIDGTGIATIQTGLGFFDHMLEQISRHGNMDLDIQVKGDLHVDEHHTIEDLGLALGDAFLQALGTKKALKRYAFLLPMDDSLAQVAIDFGGRPWLVWDAHFKRERIGDMPTEMFQHFFKSFSDTAKCNLNIKVEGSNEHHKIESIFKAFAKCLDEACTLTENFKIPSTKEIL